MALGYSLHSVTKAIMRGSFFCAMIAAITLKVLDPFGTGKLVLFQVTYDKVIQSMNAFRLRC
jgi:hypothetical protein